MVSEESGVESFENECGFRADSGGYEEGVSEESEDLEEAAGAGSAGWGIIPQIGANFARNETKTLCFST
jgi:hypothetical protein